MGSTENAQQLKILLVVVMQYNNFHAIVIQAGKVWHVIRNLRVPIIAIIKESVKLVNVFVIKGIMGIIVRKKFLV